MMDAALLDSTVSTSTILLRHKESNKIKNLPTTEATPAVVMLCHAREMRAAADALEKAAEAGPGEITKAVELYSKWRFVTDNWPHDMRDTIKRCTYDSQEGKD